MRDRNRGYGSMIELMELIVYEDRPGYGAAFKAILALPIAILLLVSYQAVTGGQAEGSLVGLAVAAAVVLLLWLLMPRRYVVMNDRLKVILGGPFAVTVRYDNIRAVSAPPGPLLTMNLATSLSPRRVVYVVCRKGMSLAITPSDRDAFLNHVNTALKSYARSTGLTGV